MAKAKKKIPTKTMKELVIGGIDIDCQMDPSIAMELSKEVLRDPELLRMHLSYVTNITHALIREVAMLRDQADTHRAFLGESKRRAKPGVPSGKKQS